MLDKYRQTAGRSVLINVPLDDSFLPTSIFILHCRFFAVLLGVTDGSRKWPTNMVPRFVTERTQAISK